MARMNAAGRRKGPLRVVAVDDSLTMRRWLSSVIARDPRLELVGMAASAYEARTVIKAQNPDVLTLDVEMPGMDGLEFLAHLMRLRPMPVVMLASAMRVDSPYARRAMELGAVVCVSKPAIAAPDTMRALCDAIAMAGVGNVHPRASRAVQREETLAGSIILVGASTGGVAAIETLLMQLPPHTPPIVIAQHMPQSFLESFAARLDRIVSHDVAFCTDGMRLQPGQVRIAPSEQSQTCVIRHSGAWHVQHVPRGFDHAYCPSVDVLFSSASPWAEHVGAILLTGLGNDGAKGMRALRRNGARTLGQSSDSCVVYGMPGAALALDASEDEVPVERIGMLMLERMGIGAGAV